MTDSVFSVEVPKELQDGVQLTKVTSDKQRAYTFKIDSDSSQILWDSRKAGIIPIENIREIRSGFDARYYREQFRLPSELEECWTTIIYILDGSYETIHLLSPTKKVFELWDLTIRKLYSQRQRLIKGMGTFEQREALWEKQYWTGADEESDGKLDLKNVEKLCQRINYNLAPEELKKIFEQADRQKRGFLDFEDFPELAKTIKHRPELVKIYENVSAGGPLEFAMFVKFMRNSQKSTLSDDQLHKVFMKYATVTDSVSPSMRSTQDASTKSSASTQPQPSTLTQPTKSNPDPSAVAEAAKHVTESPALPHLQQSEAAVIDPTNTTNLPMSSKATLSYEGFTAFLFSMDNSASSENGTIFQDMTRPLSDYYICCSHNTYLVGNQLVGVSTIEGYIRALLQSCRSVELDVYDGEKEPVIFHGNTLTHKVALRDVCHAVNKYAFVTSPYAVILSVELHCDVPQQEILVSIMKEIFGESLVCAPVDGRPELQVLPSPENLKGKILLKAKNLLVVNESGSVKEKDLTLNSESSSSESDDEGKKKKWFKDGKIGNMEPMKEMKEEFKEMKDKLKMVGNVFKTRSMSPASSSSNLKGAAAHPRKPPKTKMSLEVVSLLVYTIGVKCRGFDASKKYAPEHVFSISESTANKYLKESVVMSDLVKHTSTHIVRVYPKGTRVDSTNYEPHRFWASGAQLVAINMQTFDIGNMINHAMFRRNGGAGYVLKPKALREDMDQLQNLTKHFFTVTIISAQQLPCGRDSTGREIIDHHVTDPFVAISLFVPDWTSTPFLPTKAGVVYLPPSEANSASGTSARRLSYHTTVVKNNGFNPMWEERLELPFDCVGGRDMMDLIFVRFEVRQKAKEGSLRGDLPIAVHWASLGSLQLGFRHLPLYDSQMCQHLFSTLFVQLDIRDAT